ncbi:MAG: phosphatase PAP2 family protein [Candidatus Onthomonas sp.]
MLEALQTLDGNILLWIQEYMRVDGLNELLTRYTNLGEAGLLWIIIALAFLLFPKTRKAGLLSLIAMLICYVCNDLVIKNLIMRPRPFLSVEGLLPLIQRPGSYSFPSGHSCSSFAAASVWARTLEGRGSKGAKILLLGMAMLMALSRLYVGVHYPSDVLAGSLLGLLGGWLVCRWMGPVYDRRLSRKKAE